MTKLMSVVTDQGTAMAEATLCVVHHGDPELRGYAETVARDADDRTGPIRWESSTDNEAVQCVECGATGSEVTLSLRIDNFYEGGDKVVTEKTVTIPRPPDPVDGEYDQDWEQDYIFEQTGTGRTEGNSAYFVEVTASDDPVIPVGTEWEFC